MTEVEESTGGDDETQAEGDAEAAPESRPVDEVVARVANYDERLAATVDDMAQRIEALESDLDERVDEAEELESRLKRVRADFQNYKRRTKEREEELKERATEDLVERLLDVRDNLLRALEQDADVEVRDGVEATLSSFDRILSEEGVSEIAPEPGDEVDPTRHEVVYRAESDRPADTIDDVYRPGYELADTVVRPAQVTVSDGTTEADGDEGPGEGQDETSDATDKTEDEAAPDAADGNGVDRPEE